MSTPKAERQEAPTGPRIPLPDMLAVFEAVSALVPETGLLADPDPASFGQALAATVSSTRPAPKPGT